MANLVQVVENLLMYKKRKYAYSELFQFYYESTGNGSISSFEKFLTFCYGQNVINRSGKMQNTIFNLNEKKMLELVQTFKGKKNVKP